MNQQPDWVYAEVIALNGISAAVGVISADSWGYITTDEWAEHWMPYITKNPATNATWKVAQ